MAEYAKENKKVNFATEKEMKEVLRDEERMKKEEVDPDVFDEDKYMNVIKARSDDPKYIVPEIDSATLKQVQEMERKEVHSLGKAKGNMKLTDGVKMVEYNEWGLPKDGTDYSQFFKADESRPADYVIKPPPDYKFPHLIVDEDKEYKELTEEEKEIRDCLNKDISSESDEEDEELEDDFVLKANGGIPALIGEDSKEAQLLPKKESEDIIIQTKGKGKDHDNENDEEWDEIDEEEEEEDAKETKTKPNAKATSSVQPKEKSKEKSKYQDDEDEDVDDEDIEEEEESSDSDKGPHKAKMTKEQMHQMLDDYIKGKDPKGHGPAKTGLPAEKTLPKSCVYDKEAEQQEEKKELIEKIIALDIKAKDHENNSDSDELPSQEEKKEYDIETIATTYNNTVNRPKVLDEEPISGNSKRSKEATTASKKAKETTTTSNKNAKNDGDDKVVAVNNAKPIKQDDATKSIEEMTKEEKAKYKKDVKAKHRERRVLKKATKEAFNVLFFTQQLLYEMKYEFFDTTIHNRERR